ncbi:putative bifunctional diguanylate cyclase/phosphodiesterase [Geodermatophilus sp. CPCC 206100]|uniref:putative bifunctional diguanylate cyclase/phosphodiesterase n=1 Tax=Geodermatophilus sp. CPCC 206100 TaxID=3020054 RepID=UPI003B00C480
MISVPAPSRPAAPGASRLLRLPLVVAAALLSAATALLGAPPAVQDAACAGLTLIGAAVLLASAGRSVSPRAWRCYALAVVVAGGGGERDEREEVAGEDAQDGARRDALRTGASWTAGRVQLVTAAALFVVATLLAVHVLLHPLLAGPAVPWSLAAAVVVLPPVVAITTAAALLFHGTVPRGRQRVAAVLLGGQGVMAAALVLGVLASGLPSSALGTWVRPAMAVTVVLLCVAGRLDVPRDAPGDPRLQAVGATVSLLPHLAALVGGTLLLLLLSDAHRADPFDVVLGVLGLCALVAHQVVTWRGQHRLTAALLRSENYFRTLVRSSADPVVILDGRMRVTFASRALADLLGRDPQDAVGRSLVDWLHPDDVEVLTATPCDGSAVRTGRVRHADGRWRLIQATVRDLRQDPDVGAFVLYCRAITSAPPAADAGPALLELALADPDTGLPNRAALVRRLAALRTEAGGRPRSLAVVGIAGLVPGPAHDVAGCLARGLRGEDWLARTKDGDFAVVVAGSVADAEVLATRLVTAVGALPGARLHAWAGVTAVPPDADPSEALRAADLALRSARTGGPGCVRRADEALRLQRDRRDTLRADLAGALGRGELRLAFQPVVDVVLHRTVSVEALLRWRHPVFGEISPAEFVPLAEESSLITELGRWVLAEACTTVAGLPDPDLAVAVNVSARQAAGGSLVRDVLAALASSGLPASRLTVELTESVLADEEVVEDLATLRRLGVRVAVDDFGTGWSSLAYLVGLPIDVLKLDQQFLAGMQDDPQRQALCRSVLHLGGSLDLAVVVEGVATEPELRLLRDMGHRFLQGYALSRPLEVARLAAGDWPTGLAPVAGAHPVG